MKSAERRRVPLNAITQHHVQNAYPLPARARICSSLVRALLGSLHEGGASSAHRLNLPTPLAAETLRVPQWGGTYPLPVSISNAFFGFWPAHLRPTRNQAARNTSEIA